MSCYHPVEVGILRKPGVPGGPRVRCAQVVPCGHCLGCRAEQARQWTVRLMHEREMHDHAWFATLTYSDEELPDNAALRPEHLRGFFKALRRKARSRLSYYACGEYGERTLRPHYHAVLFGAEFLDRDLLRFRDGYPVWRSKTLESCWPHGLSEFGTVTADSCAYVAGYVRKKVGRRQAHEHLDRLDVTTGELLRVRPEFARMSLRPAIGVRWLERYWRDVYPRDAVVVDGKEYKPPRYYDKWMEQEHDPSRQENPCEDCSVHRRMMFDVRLKRDAEYEDLREGRLEAKERIHKSRVRLYQQRGGV